MFRQLLILFFLPVMVFGAENNSFTLNDGVSQVTATVQMPGLTVIDLKIGKLDYENAGSDGQIEISLPKEFSQSRGSFLGSQSSVLPTITRLIAIPFDSDPAIRVMSSNFSTLDNINLAAADQEELDALAPQKGNIELNAQPDLVRGEVAGVMRDLRLYAITISPVQYDPQNHQLRVCNELEIEVSHPGTQITNFENQFVGSVLAGLPCTG